MSWLNIALGLLREAAQTDAGRSVIDDLKSRAFGKDATPSTIPADLDLLRNAILEYRQTTDHNIDTIVQMVNRQQDELKQAQIELRRWSRISAGLALLALGVAVAALVRTF